MIQQRLLLSNMLSLVLSLLAALLNLSRILGCCRMSQSRLGLLSGQAVAPPLQCSVIAAHCQFEVPLVERFLSFVSSVGCWLFSSVSFLG